MNSPPSDAALGIDIGGTSVKAALLIDGAPAWTARSNPHQRPSVDEIAAAIRTLFASIPTPPARPPTHVGVCLPGLYDPAAGIITRSANVPGLVGVPVSGLIADALDLPALNIRVCTDAYAGAYDLWRLGPESRGSGAWHGRLLALSLGTGVGASVLDPVLDDARPLSVSADSPGHIGQIDVTIDDASEPVPVGPDGGLGGLEAYIGLPALRNRYGADLDARLGVLGRDDPPLRALARAIRIAHAIYRPQHVALLGGVGLRLRPAAGALRQLVSDGLTSVARPGWTLEFGTHEHHAAIGAARLSRRPL